MALRINIILQYCNLCRYIELVYMACTVVCSEDPNQIAWPGLGSTCPCFRWGNYVYSSSSNTGLRASCVADLGNLASRPLRKAELGRACCSLVPVLERFVEIFDKQDGDFVVVETRKRIGVDS